MSNSQHLDHDHPTADIPNLAIPAIPDHNFAYSQTPFPPAFRPSLACFPSASFDSRRSVTGDPTIRRDNLPFGLVNPALQKFTHLTEILQLCQGSSLPSIDMSSSGGNGPASQARMYELKVVQQPLRARMCGFGDKDRRPATPPPIVQLIVKDLHGAEVDVDPIDVSFFVLLTDLFSADGSKEMNTVAHPSMTAAADREREVRDRAAGERKGSKEWKNQRSYRTPPITTTRNLIGSLVANAAKLMGLPEHKLVDGEPTSSADDGTATTAEGGKWGIYFVFQDLSVRTEGKFRLKFSFVDLQSEEGLSTVNTGVSQVRAEVFSDRFTVYSAKNFPGMAESTDLSRCFAGQGIKIHVRRDLARRRASQLEEGSNHPKTPITGSAVYGGAGTDDTIKSEEETDDTAGQHVSTDRGADRSGGDVGVGASQRPNGELPRHQSYSLNQHQQQQHSGRVHEAQGKIPDLDGNAYASTVGTVPPSMQLCTPWSPIHLFNHTSDSGDDTTVENVDGSSDNLVMQNARPLLEDS